MPPSKAHIKMYIELTLKNIFKYSKKDITLTIKLKKCTQDNYKFVYLKNY